MLARLRDVARFLVSKLTGAEKRKAQTAEGKLTAALEAAYKQTKSLTKVTKSKSVFPTDDSLFKMLYLAMMDITKKWTGRRQDWSVIHAQLSVFFVDRMPD